jgi:hypothetical protein
MKLLQKLLATTLVVMAGTAYATVLDFNSVSTQFWIDNYSESGFNFSRTFGDGMGTMADPVSYWNGNGTGNLLTWTNIGSDSGFTLTSGSNQNFSLASFDYGNGYVAGNDNPTQFIVTGTTGLGGTVSAVIDHSGLGIGTYDFGTGWDNLTSVTFDAVGASNRAIFDNIVVNAAQVPEPATLALLGLGLFGFAATRRRKL